MLDFRILGPLEVVSEHGSVRLRGPKQRATLAILLLHANSVVSVDRLADDLYAGQPPVTAVTQVQRQISELRKALGSGSPIDTRPPGYVIRLGRDQLDLNRFERGAGDAGEALARGDARLAAGLLREALGLWRGTPLADLAYESFARPAIERLEEIRLAALEQRIEADLALGRHAELVAELETLVAEEPLRERLRGQLMIALYRSGRQADALQAYRGAREALVAGYGIEPSPALRGLERAILTQESSLDLGSAAGAPAAEPSRPVLVVARDDGELERLIELAAPLGRMPGRELIVVRLVADDADLAGATAAAARARPAGVAARAAGFTTDDPAGDVVRLARTHGVELVLLAAPFEPGDLTDDLSAILRGSPADVAVASGGIDRLSGSGVFVPFGGGEHDWAAVELGAWLALATAAPLRLVGTEADPRRGRRDASRLLADASLAVQRVAGVDVAPMLVEPTEEALVAAVELAALVVVGISPRWATEGIGARRRALVRGAQAPVLLVHKGSRPGGLAPRESRTRFTWSLDV